MQSYNKVNEKQNKSWNNSIQLGIDLYASMTPAKEVGGDLYDFFLKDKKLYVCVGDVSGKGVPASMTMAVAVNLFRSEAKEGVKPAHIATRINDTLSVDNGNSIFVTMFIAEIDVETGRMDFCNATHVGGAGQSDDLTILCLKIS